MSQHESLCIKMITQCHTCNYDLRGSVFSKFLSFLSHKVACDREGYSYGRTFERIPHYMGKKLRSTSLPTFLCFKSVQEG